MQYIFFFLQFQSHFFHFDNVFADGTSRFSSWQTFSLFFLFPVFLLKYEAGTAFKLITTFLQKKTNKKNEFVVWYF